MPTIEISHCCGHKKEKYISDAKYYPSLREFLASKVCEDCWKKERHEQAKVFSETYCLAPLVGTPKQIGWAETIREAIFKQIQQYFNKWDYQTPYSDHPLENGDYCRDDIGDAMVWIAGIGMAEFWIENRFKSGLDLLVEHIIHRESFSTKFDLLAQKTTERIEILKICDEWRAWMAKNYPTIPKYDMKHTCKRSGKRYFLFSNNTFHGQFPAMTPELGIRYVRVDVSEGRIFTNEDEYTRDKNNAAKPLFEWVKSIIAALPERSFICRSVEEP